MSRLLRIQSPITVLMEGLFVVLLLAVFWASPGIGSRFEHPTSNQEERPRLVVADADPATSSPSSSRTSLATVVNTGLIDSAGLNVQPQQNDPRLTCTELIVNGDFENLGGWTMPLADRPAAYTGERRFSGERSLKLGLDLFDENMSSDSTATQWIDLPADADQILLRVQIWPISSGDNADTQYLLVTDDERTITVLQENMNSQEWQSLSYNLTPWRGQPVRILFGVYNDGDGGQTALFVDHVSVEACHVAGPAPMHSAQPITDTDELTETVAIHLPMLASLPAEPSLHTPTPTATVEPTATLEPVNPCQSLLTNGDFETDEDWIMPVTNGRARYTTEQVFAGERSMQLGLPVGTRNIHTDSTAYRTLQLPNSGETLTLRAQVWRSGAEGDRDFHYLWVIAGGRTYRVFQELVDSGEWQPIVYDLTALKGKRILLFLGTYNNGTGGQAAMYVDNVEIEHCDTGQVSATPTPAASPGPTATPTTTPEYAPVAEMRSPDFGANAFLWWRSEIADRDLQLIDEGNFRWVRQSFAWEDMEVAQGEFHWENADRVVQQVNEQGLNLLARLGTDPDLAEFWAGRPPQSLDAFVDFVEALARRYNCTAEAVGCIQAYQIWNEPNLAREWGGSPPNPARYAELLEDAYAVVKAANPNALVISAGMAPTGTDNAIAMPDEKFYQQLYETMDGSSKGYFDLLGVHAAGFAAPPELDPAEAAANPQYGGWRFFSFRHVEDIRNIMVDFGDSETRIAILEFGWTSDAYNPDYIWFGAGAGIDEFVKADYLVRSYQYAAEHWQPWIALMSVLTMPNLDWLEDGNPYDEEQYWWAISEPSAIDELRLRPAYVALCGYLNELDGESCLHSPEE